MTRLATCFSPESEHWTDGIRSANQATEEGRYSAAIAEYASLIGSSDEAEARDALWGLASAYEASGQDDLALRAYSLFTYVREGPSRAARPVQNRPTAGEVRLLKPGYPGI